MNAITLHLRRRRPLGLLLTRLLARHKTVPMETSPMADATAGLTTQQRAELEHLLARGLGTWDNPPAWIVQWHDDLAHVPKVAQRPVALSGGN